MYAFEWVWNVTIEREGFVLWLAYALDLRSPIAPYEIVLN